MKKLLLFFIPLFLLASCTGVYTDESFAMNTFITQKIYGNKEIIKKNNEDFVKIESLMSKTIKGSDVFKLNEDKKATVDISTAFVIDFSLKTAKATQGAFNIAMGNIIQKWAIGTGEDKILSKEVLENLRDTTNFNEITINGNDVAIGNTNIDLGGVAKGYALDMAKKNMAEVKSGIVVVGGSVYTKGIKDGSPYVIGIKDPKKDGYMGTITLQDKCISTSGIYERFFEKDGVVYSHIIDPATLAPIQNSLLSVSVIDESGIVTDAYSTALFIMGLEDGLSFAQKNNLDAIFITKDNKVYTTNNFDYNFVITEQNYEILQ